MISFPEKKLMSQLVPVYFFRCESTPLLRVSLYDYDNMVMRVCFMLFFIHTYTLFFSVFPALSMSPFLRVLQPSHHHDLHPNQLLPSPPQVMLAFQPKMKTECTFILYPFSFTFWFFLWHFIPPKKLVIPICLPR